ncbi:MULTISPECIES: DUF982 domain-containing protein [unclassified Mesorhizobium]|nr:MULTISPECIES: DUF982 domain-containing protein [unclassified Mesorhizobium]MCA0008682.1 DUF982 domain-containing protein [Mesorhizobium sp. B264B1B]MCA0024519.1 DUF982 domain-containing protein [Mesorhizobium sp. B263B1A]
MVSSVEAAAEHLLQWSKRGPKWKQAVRACWAALAGQATPQEGSRVLQAGCYRGGEIPRCPIRGLTEQGRPAAGGTDNGPQAAASSGNRTLCKSNLYGAEWFRMELPVQAG